MASATEQKEKPAVIVPIAVAEAEVLGSTASIFNGGPSPLGRVVGAKSDTYFGFVVETVQELKRFKFALASFIFNTLRRRYRRSVLGFAWSLLNPICTMTVLTVVFGSIFKRDMNSFALFIFSGMLPWTFIQTSILAGSQSILGSESYLKRVYVPKAFFPLVSVGTESFNFVLSLSSLFIVAAVAGFHLHATALLLPAVIALTFLFAFGLAMLAGIATVYFRDLSHILGVAFQIAFYLTPIIYPIEQLPHRIQGICTLNPIYHFLLLFRDVIYEGKIPSALHWAIPIALTLASLGISFYVLKKTEKEIVFRL
jgi:ABC-2 type transport system permease protein/lipopolysaccharide transport system permease protein